MLILKKLNIEAKRRKLTLNCESSEARSEAKVNISKNQISEVKRTGLL
jgi:hypothetical protein